MTSSPSNTQAGIGRVGVQVLAGNPRGTCPYIGVLGRGVLVGRRGGAGVLKGSVAPAKMERRMDTKPTCTLLH